MTAPPVPTRVVVAREARTPKQDVEALRPLE